MYLNHNDKIIKIAIGGNENFPISTLKQRGINVKPLTSYKDNLKDFDHEGVVIDALVDTLKVVDNPKVQLYYIDFVNNKGDRLKNILLKNEIDIYHCSWSHIGLNDEQIKQLNGQCLCVTSAGNSGNKGETYSARSPYVISVGAVTEKNHMLASYSSWGEGDVDFVDIGKEVYTDLDGTHWQSQGTSYSAPKFTAKLVRFVYEYKKFYNKIPTAKQAIDILSKYSIDLGKHGKDIKYGHGYIKELPNDFNFKKNFNLKSL